MISRRELLRNSALVAGASLVPEHLRTAEPNAQAAVWTPSHDRILPLTSTSDVFVPPRGRSFMKFSFDFPEPAVEFEGLRVSFRLYTFENTYALDRDAMTVEEKDQALAIHCSQLVWAGGQQKGSGKLEARLRKNGVFVECEAKAEMDRPIKSVAAIVRGVPRGKISAGGQRFIDPKDDEVLLGYPFSGGSLFIAEGMNTPLAVIQAGEEEFFFLSALNREVKANRFYLQPGEKGLSGRVGL